MSVSHSLIVPVWVHHESAPEEEVLVYALLDEQSDACFMKSTVANALNLEGMEVNLKLSTMLGEENNLSKDIRTSDPRSKQRRPNSSTKDLYQGYDTSPSQPDSRP